MNIKEVNDFNGEKIKLLKKVEFIKDVACFNICVDKLYDFMMKGFGKKCEHKIIGNIYENPELINKNNE